MFSARSTRTPVLRLFWLLLGALIVTLVSMSSASALRPIDTESTVLAPTVASAPSALTSGMTMTPMVQSQDVMPAAPLRGVIETEYRRNLKEARQAEIVRMKAKAQQARQAAHREWEKAPTHKVRSGEVLSEIVRNYCTARGRELTSYRATAQSPWNRIENPNLIYPGDKLHIIGAAKRCAPDLVQTRALSTAGSGAMKALHFALAQRGAQYVWGGESVEFEGGFDCSGLMYASMRYAGLGIERTSAAGYYSHPAGKSVSYSDARPGDLLFFYSGISHVGMYAGNGMFVHAANPSQDVVREPLAGYWLGQLQGVRRFFDEPATSTTSVARASADTTNREHWQGMTHQEWALAAGIPADKFWAVAEIVDHESDWNPLADNPTSSAYGIPQALPGVKMASAGADWRTNPITQLRWMNIYVHERYGGWDQAVAFRRIHGWY